MRNIRILILVAATSFVVFTRIFAQNYIVNGSFERLKPLPKGDTERQIRHCAFTSSPETFNLNVEAWHTYQKVTPDILQIDSLAACEAGLPLPRTGERMLGLILYHPGTDGEHEYDYHEYVEGRLARSLQPGKKYRFSVWVREAKAVGKNHLGAISSSKTEVEPVNCGHFGVYFSTEPSDEREDIRKSIFTYDMKPQIRWGEVVSTDGDWKKISATWVPDRPYRYFIFGNFSSDGVTPTDLPAARNAAIEAGNTRQTDHFKKVKRIAYYCFDDFSLVEERGDTETPFQAPPPTSHRLVKDQKITFSATLLFDHDQSALKPEAGNVLQNLVAALQQNPSVQLEIGGHTDQTGARAYNQQLSEKRAAAVRDYLVAKGIRQDRLRVKGYGADQPVGDQQTPEGRAANRRVECIVL